MGRVKFTTAGKSSQRCEARNRLSTPALKGFSCNRTGPVFALSFRAPLSIPPLATAHALHNYRLTAFGLAAIAVLKKGDEYHETE